MEQEHTEAMQQLEEMHSLLKKQNQEILRLKFEIERQRREGTEEDEVMLTLPDYEDSLEMLGEDAFGKKLSGFLVDKQTEGKVCFELVDSWPNKRTMRYVKNDSVN